MDPARTIDVAITLIGSAMGQKILWVQDYE
jgi:hypothetical protein